MTLPKNPASRPPNVLRTESMLRHFLTAHGSCIARDDVEFNALYDGKEFPYMRDLSTLDNLNLIFQYILLDWREKSTDTPGLVADWRETLTADQDTVLDWHEQHANVFEPLSKKPRGDKMLAYKIASATFNHQLAIDQAGNALLGIEPTRLNEKPITHGGLQRQISRMIGVHNIKFTSV